MVKGNEKIARILKELPTSPGIYKMKDLGGSVIYVGKAKDLKKRVSTYFRDGYEHSTRTRSLLKNMHDIEYTMTDSELEALILEANLIRELRPRYNILMKDDKSFCYIKITRGEDYPRIRVVREREERDKDSLYIGPKTASNKIYDMLRIVKKIMPFRHCNLDIKDEGPSKGGESVENAVRNIKVTNRVIEYPCLDYYIKRCPGPCIGAVTPEAYKKIIQKITSFLQGKQEEVTSGMKEQMRALAAEKKFEQAARIRNQLVTLEAMSEKQNVDDPRRSDTDVFNFYIEMGRAFITLLLIRGGKLINQENFVLDTIELEKNTTSHDQEIMSAFIQQYYEKASDFPREIIVPDQIDDSQVLETWLSQQSDKAVSIVVPQRGTKNTLLQLAQKNATTYAKQYRIKWLSEEADSNALADLSAVLELKDNPLARMECYDISHLQGQDTVGSMVVFEKGVPKKDHYRKFTLKTTQGKPDDFHSMREVLLRRLKHLENTDDTGLEVKQLTKKDLEIFKKTFLKKAKSILANPKDYRVLKKGKTMIGMCRFLGLDKTSAIMTDWQLTGGAGESAGYFFLQKILSQAKVKRIYLFVSKKEVEYFSAFGFTSIATVPANIAKAFRNTAKLLPLAYDKSKYKIDPSFSKKPDLIVVDGGAPQLSAALEALGKLSLNLPVIALAKRLEEIYIPGKAAPILLPEGESSLRLLQRMRDEAHRFAITTHRKLHGKRFQK
ncbi:MAG: excinuclease ABC subunit UvrC [Patescibacteria group bacterium]